MTSQTQSTSDNKLFSVHVWPEQSDNESVEWRGRVTAQPDGDIAYFRTWEALIAYMQTKLELKETDNAAA